MLPLPGTLEGGRGDGLCGGSNLSLLRCRQQQFQENSPFSLSHPPWFLTLILVALIGGSDLSQLLNNEHVDDFLIT